ncbi:MAG: hypothetical protein ACXVPU_05570 [Bacteroidia bacterium]
MKKDNHIIEFLKQSDGIETKIRLTNGKAFSVWNIAWGYDIGDEFAHITTNVSPKIDSAEIHSFNTNEIETINFKPTSKLTI